MFILEYKLRGKPEQFKAIDEGIRTVQFVRKFSKSTRSIEYKKSGWKLDRDNKRITFTDGINIGTLKLIGSRDLFYISRIPNSKSKNSKTS